MALLFATSTFQTKSLMFIFVNLFVLCLTILVSVIADEPMSEGSIINLFDSNENTEYLSDEYVALKKEISLNSKDAERLFQKVKRQLLKHVDKIKEKGSEIIPETSFQKIASNGGHLPEATIRKVEKHGILIVRNTIPAKEVLEMMPELVKYLYDNELYTTNMTKTAFEIYWSKPQIQARQHPNMIAVQKALLEDLWHTNEDNEVDVDLR